MAAKAISTESWPSGYRRNGRRGRRNSTSGPWAGEGTADDALEGLAIIWPGYFSSPDKAPPMPPLSLSLECYAGTFASIHWHLEHKTLERRLPSLKIPAVFWLGAASPIPPQHGVASAALIPGAHHMIEDDCGHFLWLERPGSVRRALQGICS